MNILTVNNLCKKYPSFELKNVSFNLSPGKITGFIGRNGAGKTTTLKSIINFVHPDSGSIRFFDKNFHESELEIKQRIGYVSGGINYYPKRTLKAITENTSMFFKKWDKKAYKKYMDMFSLAESKTPSELSEGMKVKYSLALALSHNAELLILDEPTSGLDPISRDELLDIFMTLSDMGITILFSTHITSDLDKCADNIMYIKKGQLAANEDLKSFLQKYKSVELTSGQLNDDIAPLLIGCKKSKNGYSAMIKATDALFINAKISDAELESVMIHMEKEDNGNEKIDY